MVWGKNPRQPLGICDEEGQSGQSMARALWLWVLKPRAHIPSLPLCTTLLPRRSLRTETHFVNRHAFGGCKKQKQAEVGTSLPHSYDNLY